MAARELSKARRVIAWLRLVAPPTWIVAIYLVVLVAMETVAHWSLARDRQLPGWNAKIALETAQLIHAPRDIWLAVGLLGWSVWRVGSTHPYYRPAYAEWLAYTPWRRRLPLPAGPIQIVSQDVLVVGGLMLLAMHSSFIGWSRLFAFFAMPYLGLLAIACAARFAVLEAYAIGFGLALAVWLRLTSLASVAVLVGLYPIALLGLHRSLDQFPWGVRRFDSFQDFLNLAFGRQPGWPYLELAPAKAWPSIALREVLLVPWLSAAWLFALASCCKLPEDRPAVTFMVTLLTIAAATLARLMIYSVQYKSPLSLFGRIGTGRLLIPAYDRVFLPAIVSLLALVVASRSGPWLIYAGPMCLALGLAAQLGMGPSLRTWALTTPHRLVAARSRNEYVEL